MIEIDMKGKTALVVGASTGIGFATAIKFAAAGADVVIGSSNPEKGAKAIAELQAINPRALYIQTDVRNGSDVQKLISGTVEKFGRLDYAVNCAGTDGDWCFLHETPEEEFDRTIAINLKGVWLAMKNEIPVMLNQGAGVIINISSGAGSEGIRGMSSYAASKHAVNGLTKSAAIEYGEAGIRILSIRTGVVRTPMLLKKFAEMPGGGEEKSSQRTVFKRLGEPEEVANLAVWLCSDEASFITGAVVPADGGQCAGLLN